MIRATAPGKLILAGEHAAVYGRPALVAAIGARTAVTVGTGSGSDVRLELPDVGVEETISWEAIREYGARARSAWQVYRTQPGARSLAALSGGDPAHVVKIALAEIAQELGVSPSGVLVRVESQLPVGAGFGSSASVAVATIGALSMQLVEYVEDALVERVGLEVERRQHGRPSGADHATVLHGGVQWFEPAADGRLARRTLAFDRAVLQRLRVYQSGVPRESTGEVVESVRERFREAPDELDRILDLMETDVRGLRETLASGAEGPRGLCELISSFEHGLERLGVVPEPVRSALRSVESAGGAAKVSGAGALSGVAAGAILACPASSGSASLQSLDIYRALEVELGVAGLELELGLESASA